MPGVLSGAVRGHEGDFCQVGKALPSGEKVKQPCSAADIKAALWYMLDKVGIKGYKLWFSDTDQ